MKIKQAPSLYNLSLRYWFALPSGVATQPASLPAPKEGVISLIAPPGYTHQKGAWLSVLSLDLGRIAHLPVPEAKSAWSGSLLKNGDFSGQDALADWKWQLAGVTRQEVKDSLLLNDAPPDGVGQVVRLDVRKVGADSHSVQYYQAGLNLTAGTPYTLTFWVRTTSPRPLDMEITTDEQEPHSLGLSDYRVTTLGDGEWKRFSRDFTATRTTERNGRLTFLLGSTPGKVDIAGVTLRPLGEQALPVGKLEPIGLDRSDFRFGRSVLIPVRHQGQKVEAGWVALVYKNTEEGPQTAQRQPVEHGVVRFLEVPLETRMTIQFGTGARQGVADYTLAAVGEQPTLVLPNEWTMPSAPSGQGVSAPLTRGVPAPPSRDALPEQGVPSGVVPSGVGNPAVNRISSPNAVVQIKPNPTPPITSGASTKPAPSLPAPPTVLKPSAPASDPVGHIINMLLLVLSLALACIMLYLIFITKGQFSRLWGESSAPLATGGPPSAHPFPQDRSADLDPAGGVQNRAQETSGPRLIGLRGVYAGSAFPIAESPAAIGRDTGNLVTLTRDNCASRHHAVIRQEEGQFFLTDNGSSNGTFVNGVLITCRVPQRLQPGDEVQIGTTRFRFEL